MFPPLTTSTWSGRLRANTIDGEHGPTLGHDDGFGAIVTTPGLTAGGRTVRPLPKVSIETTHTVPIDLNGIHSA